MTLDIPNDLLEIQDPDIDPAQIMEQIRQGIQRRRQELGYPRQSFPTFDAAAYPGEPEGEPYDIDLYYHLRRANELYYQVSVESSLSPSPATRLPLVGRLWSLVRQEAHNMVLFYVGKLAGQQVAVNRHLVSALNRLVIQGQAQKKEIEALRQEIEQLRTRPGTRPE